MLSRKEKNMLRVYWRQYGGYHAVKIDATGSVLAQQRLGGPWGILETPAQAKKSAAELIKRHHDYLRWKTYYKDPERRVRKR
jgi:hypothetical protein